MSTTLEITVPAVGESIASGILTSWNVEDGGYVEKGQALFELETDKASTEVPALESGIVRHKAQPGDEVAIGAVVGSIETGAAKPAASAKAAKPAEEKKEQPAPAKAAVSNGPAPATPRAAELKQDESRVVATSVARKVAEDHGIELAAVTGSGAGGRITREDVEAEVARRSQPAAEKKEAAPAKAPQPAHTVAAGPDQTREKMTMLRRRIAERLVEAQHTAAMLTTFNDVDMSAVLALRGQFKEAFKEKHGVGLGFMSFFVSACVEALKQYPRVNAFIDGNEIVYNHRYHVGVAVSTDRGLVVPVVRNAETLNFVQIEKTILDFAKRARDNKIDISELQGGTFTISNGGVFGSMLSTPILNPPQSAILGMHRIEERPVARDGQVVIRPMMYLALSYDHRIIDGREAVSFLVRVKECIENPARLLLSV
jgi:2-oxoglutarate dehydrogenase E2 component (dihydrolipoamide succinyltransferase)